MRTFTLAEALELNPLILTTERGLDRLSEIFSRGELNLTDIINDPRVLDADFILFATRIQGACDIELLNQFLRHCQKCIESIGFDHIDYCGPIWLSAWEASCRNQDWRYQRLWFKWNLKK